MLGSIPNPLNAARLNIKVCKDLNIDCDLERKRAATGQTHNPIAADTEHTHILPFQNNTARKKRQSERKVILKCGLLMNFWAAWKM